MSQLLLARNKIFSSKLPLIFIAASAVNILIFYLILQMVSHEHKPLNKIDSTNFLDFIHFKETAKIEASKIENKKLDPPKEKEKLAPPELPQPEIKNPVKTHTELPSPDINIPLSINSVPYIGDFLKSGQSVPQAALSVPVIATNLLPTLKTKPAYPPRALRSGVEGIVTVEFTIDRSVLKAIKKWKFNPETVEKRARQDIHFRLQK